MKKINIYKTLFLNDFFNIFLISFLILIYYHELLLGQNLFTSNELDIYVLFDNFSQSDLSGWRADKIIGTNMLVGDPSYNNWSFINLIYQLPIDNKITIHISLFFIGNIYAATSIYYLINFANPGLPKLFSALISSLVAITVIRLEYNYVMSWVLVYPTIAFTSIILFKYFQTNNNKFIFFLFINFFIGFNFGSIFAIQQSLFLGAIFSILYSIYFKKNMTISFIKISIISLLFLILCSSWIFYPYILEKIYNLEGIVRTASYTQFTLLQFDHFFFKLFVNTVLGPFFNSAIINFPDRGLLPSFNLTNMMPLFFNLVWLYYITRKENENFWIFVSKWLILILLIHTFLSEISPLYYSLNLFILDTMSWSKISNSLLVFQLLLLSFFITEKKIIIIKPILKKYFFVLILFIIILLFIFLDNILNINITKQLLTIILVNPYAEQLIIKVIPSLSLASIAFIIENFFLRLKYISDINLIILHLSSLVLLLLFFVKSKIKFNNKMNTMLIIFIIMCNYFSVSHFTPIEKKNNYLWKNAINQNVIPDNARFLALSDNYLNKIQNLSTKLNNLNIDKLKKWDKNNAIKVETGIYSIMATPFMSFSGNASHMPKRLNNDFKKLFKLVPENIRNEFSSRNSFEIFQEGLYNIRILKNLSVNYIYTRRNIDNIPFLMKHLDYMWNDENVYLYKLKEKALPYYYVGSKIQKIKKSFTDIEIESNEIYLSEFDYNLIKFNKSGPGKIEVNKINNGKFSINYESDYENLMVISDAYHWNWETNLPSKTKIIKANYLFKGVIMKPGKYTFEIFFNNKKYYLGIYLSMISALIILMLYLFRLKIKI